MTCGNQSRSSSSNKWKRGRKSSGADVLADSDSMPIRRPDAELPHAPRLVRDRVQIGETLRLELGVVGVDVIDPPVPEIVVRSELARRHVIRTFTEHDDTMVSGHEDPGGIFMGNVEAEHADVELCRFANVMHRENMMILQDSHLPSRHRV